MIIDCWSYILTWVNIDVYVMVLRRSVMIKYNVGPGGKLERIIWLFRQITLIIYVMY